MLGPWRSSACVAVVAFMLSCGQRSPEPRATEASTRGPSEDGATTVLDPSRAAPGPGASTVDGTSGAPVATDHPAAPASASAASTARRALRYLALGDSFTIGTGSREEQAFPAVFAKTAGCDVTLSNVARNGFTTDDVIARELPALASFKPDFVTLGIGANDFVQRHTEGAYVANVGKILDAILAAGVRPDAVVLVPQPDWSRSPAAKGFGTPDEIHARIEKMNRVLHEEGTKRGMRWLAIEPLLAAQAARRDLATDGLHPSAGAHAEWAAVLVRDVCPAD